MKQRVWDAILILEGENISRGCINFDSKEQAEVWLARQLELLKRDDGYGNYPYGGRGEPRKVAHTGVRCEWRDLSTTRCIWDY